MGWSFQNDLPIYTQLVDAIKFSIVSGELLPGARMSTVRDLALEAGVNPNTMQRALQQLEREDKLSDLQRELKRTDLSDGERAAILKRITDMIRAKK